MLAKKRTHRPEGLSSPRDIFNPATGRKRLDEDKSRNLIWPPRGIRDRNQRALRTAEKREVLQLHATNYRFQAPAPGEYPFRCDVHVNMQGKLIVHAG